MESSLRILIRFSRTAKYSHLNRRSTKLPSLNGSRYLLCYVDDDHVYYSFLRSLHQFGLCSCSVCNRERECDTTPDLTRRIVILTLQRRF
jgi:hypothetical protein